MTTVASLGTDVLAQSAQAGLVPEGCFGLSQCGTLYERHLAGKRVKVPKGGRLWWVNESPVEVRFAPQAQAPEAGVQVTLALFMPNGTLDDQWLAWLGEQPDRVDAAVLAAQLRERVPLKTLPPCVGQAELTRRARALSADLVHHVGLRCTALTRVDLYPDVDISKPAPPQPVTPPLTATRSSTPSASTPERPPDWASLAAQDQRAGRRLFLELPKLATAVRGWAMSQGIEPYAKQHDLSNRLNHLASLQGQMPTLQPVIGHGPDLLTGQLMAAHSQRAMEALSAAWVVVETVPRFHAPTADGLALLEETVKRLEFAVKRRHQPWWDQA